LNVRSDELVFTSGTTQAINLVAYSYLLPKLQAGDVILASRMEHHANLVPWQLIAERTGATVLPVEILQNGELDLVDLEKKLDGRVRL
ncbi:aminotransferase class V-fold PLP-dependent enzyme, partial [Vogesella mureinivorans]